MDIIWNWFIFFTENYGTKIVLKPLSKIRVINFFFLKIIGAKFDCIDNEWVYYGINDYDLWVLYLVEYLVWSRVI